MKRYGYGYVYVQYSTPCSGLVHGTFLGERWTGWDGMIIGAEAYPDSGRGLGVGRTGQGWVVEPRIGD
jgi:hypothetical protein